MSANNLRRAYFISVMILSACLVLQVGFFSGRVEAQVKGVNAKDKTINIALLGPLSGTYAEFGKSQEKGAEVFNLIENGMSKGPLKGYTFKYTAFDGKGDPKEAANIAQKVVIGDYFAVVGSSLSLEALAAAPILDRDKVVLYTTFAASSKLTGSGWTHVFMSFPVAQKEGSAGADVLVKKYGWKKVVEFYENTPYGQGLHEGFVARVKELGGEVLQSFTHDPKADVVFSSPLTTAKGLNPQAIFLAENYESSGIIIAQALKMGLNVPFVAVSGALNDTCVKMAGGEKAVENVMWLSLFSPFAARPKVKKFVETYQQKYGAVPDDPAALTYDALLGIKAAIELGAGSRDKLASFLHSKSWVPPEGITNKAIKHDDNGNILGSELLVIKYKNGNFALVE